MTVSEVQWRTGSKYRPVTEKHHHHDNRIIQRILFYWSQCYKALCTLLQVINQGNHLFFFMAYISCCTLQSWSHYLLPLPPTTFSPSHPLTTQTNLTGHWRCTSTVLHLPHYASSQDNEYLVITLTWNMGRTITQAGTFHTELCSNWCLISTGLLNQI